MTVVYSNDLINISFDLYEEKIIDVKILEKSEIIDRLDRLFKNKIRRYHLFEDKVYIHQRYIMFFLYELRF